MSKRIGNPDSKYTYNSNAFEIDVQAKNDEHRVFMQEVKEMVLREPQKMDLRYMDLIQVLKELKKEYRL